MNHKQYAEDALEVAKNATSADVAQRHRELAQVHATLALLEQTRIGNVLRYATDFTEEDEYKALGAIVREALGI